MQEYVWEEPETVTYLKRTAKQSTYFLEFGAKEKMILKLVIFKIVFFFIL